MDEEKIIEGYEKIAFGSINDPIRLLFCDEINPRALKRLDLFSVAEIKRPKGGGIEIKFFDRIKALQCLETMTQTEKRAPGGFYEALESGANNLRRETDE